MKFTVTIARQLGSAGSEIGQNLAAQLGVRCIDREIVSHTAQQSGLSEDEVAAREERVASFWERMLVGLSVAAPEAYYVAPPFETHSDRELFESETEVMKAIAQQENCVIVGRGATHILPKNPCTVNLYLHAPLSFRIPRVMKFYGATDETQARDMIRQSDAMREKYIAQMTGRNWTSAENYHLCIDSSSLPMPELCDFLVAFVQRKIKV